MTLQMEICEKVDLREIGCEDGRWTELAQDRVSCQVLVLAVLNIRVLLPEGVADRIGRHTFCSRPFVSTVFSQ
jgi:hypothetical protein